MWCHSSGTAEHGRLASPLGSAPEPRSIGSPDVVLGQVDTEEMLAGFRELYDQADVVTGHYIRKHDLRLEWIIETHVHADHLSAAPYIQSALGGKIGIGILFELGQSLIQVFKPAANILAQDSDAVVFTAPFSRILKVTISAKLDKAGFEPVVIPRRH